MKPARRHARGFTLLEMLVVIVLIAAVSAMTFDGMSQMAAVRVKLRQHLDGAVDSALIGRWFRSSVSGTLPDYVDGQDAFRGDSRSFTGLTLQPLDEASGVPTRYGWRLEEDAAQKVVRLSYTNGVGGRKVVGVWPGSGAGFSYAGSDGEWTQVWPPALSGTRVGTTVDLNNIPQIPQFVRLNGGTSQEAIFELAGVSGSLLARMRTSDHLKNLLR